MTPWRTRIGFGLIALIVVIGMGTFGWLSIYRPGHELLQVVDGDVVRGAPQPWQLNFQAPHSPLDRGLYAFHNFLFLINLAICALVLALLLFAVWRFSGRLVRLEAIKKAPEGACVMRMGGFRLAVTPPCPRASLRE